jgi:hypothetical protein
MGIARAMSASDYAKAAQLAMKYDDLFLRCLQTDLGRERWVDLQGLAANNADIGDYYHYRAKRTDLGLAKRYLLAAKSWQQKAIASAPTSEDRLRSMEVLKLIDQDLYAIH